MKLTTLIQEVIRRQKNTARNVEGKRRNYILTKLMCKMKRSGYDEKMRRKVLVAGMKGYERMVLAEENGGRKINRPMVGRKSGKKIQKARRKIQLV